MASIVMRNFAAGRLGQSRKLSISAFLKLFPLDSQPSTPQWHTNAMQLSGCALSQPIRLCMRASNSAAATASMTPWSFAAKL